MEPVIKIQDLSFKYYNSSRNALFKINLEVFAGDFVLVTGPSGCGKSTLLRCLNGLIPHFYQGEFSGHVFVEGTDTRTSNVSELSKLVGLVFSDPESQLLTLEVAADVAFGPENLGLPRDEIISRVDWAIKNVGIEGLRHFAPFELSGGEQQKVAIASILSIKPKVLVLDEPTANLDPKSAKSIIHLLGDLSEQGVTIIVAEHRLDLVSQYSNKVVLMQKGEVKLEGEPEKVFTSNLTEELGVDAPVYYSLSQSMSKVGLRVNGVRSMEELVRALEVGDVICDQI
jgi:energy-coupling factor transporter ATP-binding protein EcfA2